MEILSIAIGLFADANPAWAPEHALHLGHDPLGLVHEVAIAELFPKRDQQNDAEGIGAEITQPVRPDPLLAHPLETPQDLRDLGAHHDGPYSVKGCDRGKPWAAASVIGCTLRASSNQMYSSNWWGKDACR